MPYSIVGVGMPRIDVELGRYDIEIAGKHSGNTGALQPPRMAEQALKPGELVVELGAGMRIAIRQIDAAHQDASDGSLDVPVLRVVIIAGKPVSGENRFAAAREDGNAVPGPLSAPDRVIAKAAQFGGGKG